MENKLLNTLIEVLKKDERFLSNEWDLLKNKIREKAEILDEELIWLILDNKILRDTFFINVSDVIVFDNNKFIQFINNKEFLPDSFTSFKNKIWLTNKQGDFISSLDDIVLSWPYKDCILAWWQDKEDVKRDEVFYNEILWSEDIDRLLDEKVFTNFKKIDKDWEQDLKWFNRDKNWMIKDNLIIKWNNLLALHSLKSNFAWKVKLIYIDPPYNTWNDSFKYNDRFNHSTWLTFMKNRLEVAKELLSKDWVIFVQCDDNEQAYLKVLMDWIFWWDNFISNVIYKRRLSQANLSKNISPIHDFIILYSKTNSTQLNRITANIDESNYKNPDNDPRWPYVTMPSTNKWGAVYEIITPTWKKIKEEWRFKEETYRKLEKDNKLVFPNNWNWKPRYKLFLEEKKIKWAIPNTIWDDISSNQEANKEIIELFWKNAFSFPKSEDLIKRIIELWTKPWDLVLDFHLWSWTTTAVAHKMWRQYIGIEQMDYIEDITVERIKKVIKWEKWWISKSLEWKWWGNFIYMELMKENEIFINNIKKSKKSNELIEIYKKIKKSWFINYNVDIKLIDENISEFEILNLENQKIFLIELLDKNLLLKNFSDINDKNNWINSKDKKLNNLFYI